MIGPQRPERTTEDTGARDVEAKVASSKNGTGGTSNRAHLRAAMVVQRTLLDRLAHVNQQYLSKFVDEFPDLRLFKTREEVLRWLHSEAAGAINSDELLVQALRTYPFAGAAHPVDAPPAAAAPPPEEPGELPAVAEAEPAEAAASREPPAESAAAPLEASAVDMGSSSEAAAPAGSSSSAGGAAVAVISSAPPSSPLLRAVPMAAPSAAGVGRAEDVAVGRVMELYDAGTLLVTAIQARDLHSLHSAAARTEIASHAVGGTMRDIPAAPRGAMANVKVNWTMTSPRMQPHYFKMIESIEDRSPKASPSVLGDRIATMVDPTHPDLLYMTGKGGTFEDWRADQSSSKHAGVHDGARLYGPDEVGEHLRGIRDHLERGGAGGTPVETNPEINTFGFPPAAVVGFLVVRLGGAERAALTKAKAAMSEEEQARPIPVFTWRRAEDRPWTLEPLGMI